MRRWLLAVSLVAASCFSPEARDGLPCSQAGDCPPGQTCQVGICSSGAVADAGATDAAAIDAAPAAPGDFGPVELIALTCSAGVACTDARDPFLSADGGSILFTRPVATPAGNYDIDYAVRTGPTTFMQAASIGAINTGLSEHSPFLSADGTTLWFSRQDISSGAAVRPYDEILVSKRDTGLFDLASGVEGGVDTVLGDERSAQVSAGGGVLLFTRAPENAPVDHDVYLARFESGQWNTIERIDALSVTGGNERSIAVVEERQAIFYIRDEHIHEVLWSGDQPTAIAVDVVHDELDAVPLDVKVGLWSSPDGSEIWFDSNRSGMQQIYRAVRPPPTSLSARARRAACPAALPGPGGRIQRRPIP